MSNLLRRFEILLPTRFNDGSEVPAALFAKTILELRSRFHGVSSETQLIRGEWENGGAVYRDELIRLFVDVADTAGNRKFFRGLKERLKKRFLQIDIRITTYLIEVF